ncbi:MAG: alpha-E domain-containing protein [Acidimicrobiia bacterium]|nr:alpha-E domain-containing protein [Acidimicrobiia bacterium]
MLSRHAEDLYWTGRYIERAEDTARLLDVTHHGMLELSGEDAAQANRDVLEVLSLETRFTGSAEDSAAVTNFLVLDQDNPGSISSAVARARTNARGLRDRISSELWEAINSFYLDLQALDLSEEIHEHPYQVYRRVKNSCQMVTGVAAETMPRDDGYRFLTMGRLLERAEMTTRLLDVRYHRLVDSPGAMSFNRWAALLKSVSAYEAYLKEYRAAVDPIQVLAFLLLSADFPRSVQFCLQGTERELAGLIDTGVRSDAQRLLGMVCAKVEYCDLGSLLGGSLGDFLDELQEDIWQVGAAIDTHFFHHATDLDLHPYVTR